MTQNEYKQAYKEVNQEIDDQKIKLFKEQVRAYKQEQLELQEKWKKNKEDAEENLRIIKLNLENLDSGKFDAIEERMQKSQKARQLCYWQPFNIPNNFWDITWTNGTYRVGDRTFYF